jgi:hypothetical protein
MITTTINNIILEVEEIIEWGDGDPRREVLLKEGEWIIDGGDCCNICGSFYDSNHFGRYRMCKSCLEEAACKK